MWKKEPRLIDESRVVVRCRRCRVWLESPGEVAVRLDGWCFCARCARVQLGDDFPEPAPTPAEDLA